MAKRRYGATEPTPGAPDFSSRSHDPEGEGSLGRLGSKPPPGLYLVATPIGNLGDITLRGLALLRAADLVACEDTRVTGKLLSLLGISAPLAAYHEHNADTAGPTLLAAVAAGKVVVLVSDAGSPLVSDPGGRLVPAFRAAGLPVTAAPGASAVVTAVQLAGLSAERFLFAGFLPARPAARRQDIRALAAVPAALVFYESPNRLPAALTDLAEILGPRPAAVARELTKLHEEVVRDDLPALAARYAAQGAPKGEVAIVVAPPSEAAADAAGGEDDLDTRLSALLDQGVAVRDAAALVAAETGYPRRTVYARALRLSLPREA